MAPNPLLRVDHFDAGAVGGGCAQDWQRHACMPSLPDAHARGARSAARPAPPLFPRARHTRFEALPTAHLQVHTAKKEQPGIMVFVVCSKMDLVTGFEPASSVPAAAASSSGAPTAAGLPSGASPAAATSSSGASPAAASTAAAETAGARTAASSQREPGQAGSVPQTDALLGEGGPQARSRSVTFGSHELGPVPTAHPDRHGSTHGVGLQSAAMEYVEVEQYCRAGGAYFHRVSAKTGAKDFF